MPGITPVPETSNFEQFMQGVNERLMLLAGAVDPEVGGGQTVAEAKAEILALIAALKVYDQAPYYLGKPGAGARVYFLPVGRAFDLPIDCAGSRGRGAIAPTADVVFTIKRNGTTIGTATFPAGVLIPTFSMSVVQNFVPGDFFEVFGPNPQDATLEDICFLFLLNFT